MIVTAFVFGLLVEVLFNGSARAPDSKQVDFSSSAALLAREKVADRP